MKKTKTILMTSHGENDIAMLEMQRKYKEAIDTFTPQINSDCPNYKKAIAWCKKNGYTFKTDISYNGYIYVEKFICDKDSKIEIKFYDGIIKDALPQIEIFNMEANFGNIMSETTYSYKRQRGFCLDPQSIEETFALALEKEKEWEAEWTLIKNK